MLGDVCPLPPNTGIHAQIEVRIHIDGSSRNAAVACYDFVALAIGNTKHDVVNTEIADVIIGGKRTIIGIVFQTRFHVIVLKFNEGILYHASIGFSLVAEGQVQTKVGGIVGSCFAVTFGWQRVLNNLRRDLFVQLRACTVPTSNTAPAQNRDFFMGVCCCFR